MVSGDPRFATRDIPLLAVAAFNYLLSEESVQGIYKLNLSGKVLSLFFKAFHKEIKGRG